MERQKLERSLFKPSFISLIHRTQQQQRRPPVLWIHLNYGGCAATKMRLNTLRHHSRRNLMGCQHLLHEFRFQISIGGF